MTISAGYTPDSYAGNDVTLTFAVSFPFFEEDELEVVLLTDATGVEAAQVLNTDYTVTGGAQGLALAATGSVIMEVEPATGETLVIHRTTDREQQLDLTRGGPLAPNSMEGSLDRAIMLDQEDNEGIGRSLQVPKSDDATLDMELPSEVDRASTYLGFDSDGEPIALAAPTSTALTTSFTETLLDDANAAAARTTLDAQEDVVTTRGDVVRGDASGDAERLALGADGTILSSDGTDVAWAAPEALETPLPRSYLAGLTLTNDTDTDHDIAIAVGECRDSTNAINIKVTSALGKMLDATWEAGGVPGTTVGGLNATDFATGTSGPEASTRYHIFLILHTDGTVDAGFDKDDDATNLLSDSGYTYYRRIGSIWTDASENFLGFTQHGDVFLINDPVVTQHTGIGTGGENVSIPVGPNSLAVMDLDCDLGGAGAPMMYVSSPYQDNEAPHATNPPLFSVVEGTRRFGHEVLTSADSEIQVRSESSSTDLDIIVRYYTDRRGRDD